MGKFGGFRGGDGTPKKIPETFTEKELFDIIKATDKQHHKTAWLLGFYQAMRISEVVKLKPEDIDLNQKIIRIKDAKGGKDRNIPISPKIFKGLKSKLPMPCKARALQMKFRKLGKEVLGKEMKYHNLRHSGLTHYLSVEKWNLRQVQIFAGHSSVAITQIYTHVKPDELMRVMWEGNK